MRLPKAAFWIYLAGVVALGGVIGAYESRLRAELGNWGALAAIVAYLIFLRFAAEFVQRRRRS